MSIGRNYEPPVLIPAAKIIRQERPTMVKQQHSAQHIALALIADKVRTGLRIPNCDTKMVIVETPIVRNPGLRSGEHKNPRLSITTDFIAGKCRPTFRAIQHHTGQNPFHRAAFGNHAGGVQDIDGRMLIASHIAERDT